MITYFCTHDGKNTRLACKYPNECPICNCKIAPIHLYESLSESINLAAIFFKCPSCHKGFVSHYDYSVINTIEYNHNTYYYLNYLDSFPKLISKIEFADCISNLSSCFCEIYNQAYASEIYQLNQISGIGYRKALEFLIKDYCIYKNPDKKENIKSNFLGQVINDYIDSDKIQNLAKASAWIGNDETHYIRKFENKDINDLKKFISATVAFITYELVSDEANDLVSSK